MAREKRKEKRRGLGIQSPKDTGENIPPFFLPARQKLFFQLLTDAQNSKRYARKPIPEDVKNAFTLKAKEYAAYKLAEKTLMEKEEAINVNA